MHKHLNPVLELKTCRGNSEQLKIVRLKLVLILGLKLGWKFVKFNSSNLNVANILIRFLLSV